MLEACDLLKRIRTRFVVDGASFRVDEGEIVGLLGPNGAGKTTCFYMVAGLIPCDEGSIRLDGRDITNLPLHSRARLGIGYLPQESSIFRNLSVKENILAALELRRDLDVRRRGPELERLMDELQVAHLARQKASSLSGGERRRLEIARALAVAPRHILLDEPFAGVDPISVTEIRRIVRRLAEKGIGVLITDHNVRETLGICDRAYILNEGRILTEGAPETILEDPRTREIYLGEEFRL